MRFLISPSDDLSVKQHIGHRRCAGASFKRTSHFCSVAHTSCTVYCPCVLARWIKLHGAPCRCEALCIEIRLRNELVTDGVPNRPRKHHSQSIHWLPEHRNEEPNHDQQRNGD